MSSTGNEQPSNIRILRPQQSRPLPPELFTPPPTVTRPRTPTLAQREPQLAADEIHARRCG